MDFVTKISKEIATELTEHLDLGDEMRAAGLHRQAACYDLFLDGRMPYGVMMRHFERQRSAAFRNHAGFLDKLKKLPGKVKKVVQDQAGKWKVRLDKAVSESLPGLAQLKSIEDEEGIETKKSLWQKALDKFAQNVMDDYEESLAAVKDDPAAVEEFVNKLFEGAMTKAKQGLAKTLPAFLVAGLFGGPAAVGAMFFRKALFRAAKAAIKAGDAALTRTLGDSYTEKKEQVKDVAKEKTRQIVMGVVRKVFKSQKEAGEKIGAGVGAMALILKAGKETKEALQAAHGYIEKKYGKTTADALGNILKALAIAGVMRAGASAIGVVAEWFAEDPEMADLAGALKAGGQNAAGDEELKGLLEGGADEAASSGGEWDPDDFDEYGLKGNEAEMIGKVLGMEAYDLEEALYQDQDAVMRDLAEHRGESEAVDRLLEEVGAEESVDLAGTKSSELDKVLGSSAGIKAVLGNYGDFVELPGGQYAMVGGGGSVYLLDDNDMERYREAMTRNVAKFFSEQNADPGDFSLKSLNRVKNLGMISQIYLQKLGEQHDAFDLPEGLTAEGLGIDLEAVKRGREFAEEQGL